MSNVLGTKKSNDIYESLKPIALSILLDLNELDFSQYKEKIIDLSKNLQNSKILNDEQFLNDFFIIERYLDFIYQYCELWEELAEGKFSKSWVSLQDALDLLRLIKKFSSINVSFFENQLIELEKLYPYNVFFSTAIIFEYFECTLCQNDIDSFECPHVRGELYAGKMAQAMGKNLIHTDHIAMVNCPKDKRCVVKYEDNGEQFKIIKYLATHIKSKRFKVSHFENLEFSKIKKKNPDFKKQGKNEKCACGSDLKFKKCCSSKEFIEGDHVDLIFTETTFEKAVYP